MFDAYKNWFQSHLTELSALKADFGNAVIFTLVITLTAFCLAVFFSAMEKRLLPHIKMVKGHKPLLLFLVLPLFAGTGFLLSDIYGLRCFLIIVIIAVTMVMKEKIRQAEC